MITFLARVAALPLALGLVLMSTGPAAADPPVPRLKPAVKSPAGVDPIELAQVRSAFAAAERGDWMTVKAAAATAKTSAARKLIEWRLVTDPARGKTFLEIDRALTDMADWPGIGALRESAESQIMFSGLPLADRIAWLERSGPKTGEGRAVLAESYLETGLTTKGEALLRATWRDDRLSLETQRRLYTRFSNILTQVDVAARVNLLLWLDQTTAARALLSDLSAEDRALAAARLGLQARVKKVTGLLDAVPSSRALEPGLLFDRAIYRRSAGDEAGACDMLRGIDGRAIPVAARSAFWAASRRCVNAAIKARDWPDAFAFTSRHGLISGEDFSDAEFMAGYIALRKLNRAKDAIDHFQQLERMVATPVSKARALYWLGLSYAALGDTAKANEAWTTATQYPTAFYGQLAISKVRPQEGLKLPEAKVPTIEERAEFSGRDVVRAIHLLALIDDDTRFRQFTFALDDQLNTAVEHELLAEIAREELAPEIAVRSAKAGLRRNVIAVNAAYPVIDPPPAARAVLEPALMLAIIRQETEFKVDAVSHAGARGLMQLMPATAREVALRTGVSYKLSWLIDDPEYNMRLGSTYLANMIDNWNGSYILAIASYNAGPGRAREWINAYGDPRAPNVDPLDWLESIPISETRNYVQRVMENIQVYHARLSPQGAIVPVTLLADLKRGTPPAVTP